MFRNLFTMSVLPDRFAEYLKENNLPRLLEGIRDCAAKFPGGIEVKGKPIDGRFFAQEFVELPDGLMYACAPCSVLNAIKALGVSPETTPPEISLRLMAAHNVGEGQRSLPLVLQRDDMFWVTQEGIAHLFELAKRPLVKGELPITWTLIHNMETVHEALLRGYKAVCLDAVDQRALAVIGAGQKREEVWWEFLPPDQKLFVKIRRIDPESASVSFGVGVFSLRLDPRKIMGRLAPSVCLVGSKDNPWKPPEDVSKPEEIADIGAILPD